MWFRFQVCHIHHFLRRCHHLTDQFSCRQWIYAIRARACQPLEHIHFFFINIETLYYLHNIFVLINFWDNILFVKIFFLNFICITFVKFARACLILKLRGIRWQWWKTCVWGQNRRLVIVIRLWRLNSWWNKPSFWKHIFILNFIHVLTKYLISHVFNACVYKIVNRLLRSWGYQMEIVILIFNFGRQFKWFGQVDFHKDIVFAATWCFT